MKVSNMVNFIDQQVDCIHYSTKWLSRQPQAVGLGQKAVGLGVSVYAGIGLGYVIGVGYADGLEMPSA
jgi:hypothetical protein